MTVFSRLPSGLTALYDQILSQILEDESHGLSEHARTVLRVMTAAFQPLTLWELAILARVTEETAEDRDLILEYLDLCISIVAVRRDVAYFVHDSAREHLLKRQDIVPSDKGVVHAELAIACYRYLSGQSLMNDDISCDSSTDITGIASTLIRKYHSYPVVFWLEHMRLAGDRVIGSFDVEDEFLSEDSPTRQKWLDLYWHRRHQPWEKQPLNFAAIHLAAYGGLTWLVLSLLKSRDQGEINRRDGLGYDCLMWVAGRGWTDVVNVLVDRSAKLDTTNDQLLTAVYLAAINGHAPTVRMLIEAGADVDCCDARGATLVHCVTMHQYIDILQYLLLSGAEVDVPDARNRTAILWACNGGQLAAVKVLEEHGADLTQLDREGMTLLHHAAGQGHLEIASFLLKKGVRVDSKCYGRWTPLHEAAWNGETIIVAFLLKSGPNLDERTGEGHTALHQASWNGHTDCVRLLLKHDAPVDAVCYDGKTALHQAAWQGHDEVARALVDAGASYLVRNHGGNTARHHAEENGAAELAASLALLALDEVSLGASATKNANLPYAPRAPPEHPKFSAIHHNEHDPAIELDPAIMAAIPGDPFACDCSHHGHAGFSVPLRVRAKYSDGTEVVFFCKTYGNQEMFRSEYFSLETLSTTLPTFCPRPLQFGQMQETDHFFLMTEFIDAECTGNALTERSLAEKLASLHDQPVPIPAGHRSRMFGFPMSAYCGSTPQDNTFCASLAELFAERRLGYISRLCQVRHGADDELRTWVDRMTERVVPALLQDGHLGGDKPIVPSIVHGDLWMGNQIKGRVRGWSGLQATTYDPSSVYAHNEYEFAIMRLFGGFLAGFWSRYHAIKPKTEPIEEYEDRTSLYSLYHLLNHYAMDCGGWRDDAIEVMKELWDKYGN
ncbi:hypothetical protein LTR78_003397 [Recurvomyces mirabilis]|uniref:protein-ribulosamine 3-kinase n=1 Tax=Recurvomyces mirabilis TaxID=574656 RepID=A0AAE1C3N9_9PEZI|nr:hypothetical protein LTR78_003397 [Recurvomyces mirabilis]KAK5154568.1 hypothetical protein LTS14_006706 [Recurvomyces mirabilis]